MSRNAIIGLILAGALVLVVFFIVGLRGTPDAEVVPNGINNNGIENNEDEDIEAGAGEAQRVLTAKLPRQFTVGQRAIRLDRQTVAQTERAVFSIRQATTVPRSIEDPVDYIERIIRTRLDQEHLRDTFEGYTFNASFYPLGETGITAILRVADIPDDSIGATEERFEFSYAQNRWTLDWYGERHFCRRQGLEEWRPADQLCP
jgi:hypothetical protein